MMDMIYLFSCFSNMFFNWNGFEEDEANRGNNTPIFMGSGKDDISSIPSKDNAEGIPIEVFEDGKLFHFYIMP